MATRARREHVCRAPGPFTGLISYSLFERGGARRRGFRSLEVDTRYFVVLVPGDHLPEGARSEL
jgi:hypothetical protein